MLYLEVFFSLQRYYLLRTLVASYDPSGWNRTENVFYILTMYLVGVACVYGIRQTHPSLRSALKLKASVDRKLGQQFRVHENVIYYLAYIAVMCAEE